MRILLIFLFASIIHNSNGQEFDQKRIKRHGVYLETYAIRHDFSNGFLSLNYEYAIGKKRRTYFRAGIYPDFETSVSLPLTVTWITGPGNPHHFEFGLGAVYRIEHYVDPYGSYTKEWFFDFPAAMFPLMYRYQNEKGFYARAGVNVFVSWPTLPSPSGSLGFRF